MTLLAKPLPQAPAGPDPWVRRCLARAVDLIRAEDPDPAFLLIEEVLAKVPEERRAIELGAAAALKQGDALRFGRFLSMLIAIEPGSVVRRREFARVLMGVRRPEAAADVLEPVLGGDPAMSPVLVEYVAALGAAGAHSRLHALEATLTARAGTSPNLGWIEHVAIAFVAAGDIAGALTWLGRDWPESIDRQSISFLKGKLLYGGGRQCEAEPYFLPLVEGWNDPRLLDARLFLARIARNRGDDDATLAHYSAALALKPDSEECLSFFTRYHLARRDFASANRYLAMLEGAAPASRYLNWLRASIAHGSGDTGQAIAVFRDAIAADPTNIENYGAFADLLWNLGDLEEMDAVLRAGLAQQPNSLPVLTRMLRCAEARKRSNDELLGLCDRILTIEPANEYGLRRRANALMRSGRRGEALAQFVEGTRIHPTNVLFWRSAASVASRYRLDHELTPLFERAKAQFGGGRADDLAALAEIFDAGEVTAEASARAEAALALDNGQTAARQILARRHVQAGDFSAAWPHLLELQAPTQRPIETVRLFAQVAAAFRTVRPTQSDIVALEPIEGRFPDMVFEETVNRAEIFDVADCQPIALQVTSTLASGGAERQVALTCEGFMHHPSGFRPELVAEDLSPEHGRDFFLPIVREAGVPVRALNGLHASAAWRELVAERPDLRTHIRTLSTLPLQAQRIALPLYVLLVRQRPQVVHLWQDMVAVAGGLAAVLAGVPRIVLGTRSTRPIEIQRARPFFHGAYQALLRRPGISMVGNSGHGGRDYEEWLGLPVGAVDVVANGYDFDAMQARTSLDAAAEIRRALDIPDDAVVLGGVMRYSYEKRPELWTAVACEIVGTMPGAHAILVGAGPMREQLINEVERQGLTGRIHFVGRQSPVEPWMQAMDVLFLSSLTEGLPNVLIEAQSLGVAVATMRVGGAPETVWEDRTAIVIDEGPVEAIAGRIGALLADRERRAKFGQAGVAFTRATFGKEALVEKLTGIYRRGMADACARATGQEPAMGEALAVIGHE